MKGKQNLSSETEEKSQVRDFYLLLFEKLLKQQKEIFDSVNDLSVTRDICDTILTYASQTFEATIDILDSGTQINPVLGVKEDRTPMQKKLFEEALEYLKNNMD